MKKDDREQKMREMEAKIERLEKKLGEEKGEEEKGEEEKGEEEGTGVTGGLLREIGGMFGLGGLIKGLEKSTAFQDRLKAIDEEVETKFRETPLKRVGGERGVVPHIDRSFSIRTLAQREPEVEEFVKASPARKPKREAAPEESLVKEPAIDVLDEKDHLEVIAELPGVEEKDIKIDLEGDKLTISTDVPRHKYYKEISLPCSPEGSPKTTYNNGILEIRLEKKHHD